MYISPFEVEGALVPLPDVIEAAVVAWSDEEGHQAEGFVFSNPDQASDALAATLQEHCKRGSALQNTAQDRISRGFCRRRNRQDSNASSLRAESR